LRGIALLGIFVVNIAFFASGYPFHLVPDPNHDSVIELFLPWLVDVFVTMKAYLIFSFLFGYSFTLQLDSAARRGVDFRPRFLRRLAGLFAIGLLHALLLFQGDILTTYALIGLVLFGLRRTSARTALVTAAVIIGAVAFVIALVATHGTSLVPDPAAARAAGAASTEALRGGSAPSSENTCGRCRRCCPRWPYRDRSPCLPSWSGWPPAAGARSPTPPRTSASYA
jgi:uncharacterized protein